MSDIYLKPVTKQIKEEVLLHGSKSIANRVLLLSGMSKGNSIIHGVPDSAEDVDLMIQALNNLGISITKTPNTNTYTVHGCNGIVPHKQANIFCGNSGTTLRFLTSVLALQQGQYLLTGTKRMQERPINDLVVALSSIGAKIEYPIKNFYPPLKINEFSDNNSNQIDIHGATSSQFLSSIIMASPLLGRKIDIQVIDKLISTPYIDITIALLQKFRVIVDNSSNNCYSISPKGLSAIEYTIEPDASSASYFLAIGALTGEIKINNLGTNSIQGDKNFGLILEKMGALIEYGNDFIKIKHNKLNGIKVNMQGMPDVAMTLAVVALFATGTTIINGISSWKVKETDRLQAMKNELIKLGVVVTTTEDSISITPPNLIKQNIHIDTYDDHRMAMCFSLLAVGGVAVTINDYNCVKKTFPDYFDLFSKVCYLDNY